MPAVADHTFSIDLLESDTPGAGIFTWDIESNIVFADGAVAALFGLDPDRTVQGLPLEEYLARVHPDDRPMLAKTISTTIIAEVPQQNTYRVKPLDGPYLWVAAFGRAFRSAEGTPILYSGIVVPSSSPDGGGSLRPQH